jgi:hypothetical protein
MWHLLTIEGTMASTIATAETGREDSTIKSRAYQMEMLEESLQGNVIVAVRFLPSPPLLFLLTIHNPDGYWQRQNTRVSYKIYPSKLSSPWCE